MYDDESETEPPAEPANAGPPVVSVVSDVGDLPPAAVQWLRDHAAEAAAKLGKGGEVRVRIVGDDEMARAHARYMGEAATTDVLTFDLSEGASAGGADLDADLVICADEAARRAAELGHPIERELLLYVVHGLLHCLGHDDHDPEGAEAMHRAEDELLGAIGVGPVYAPMQAHRKAQRQAPKEPQNARKPRKEPVK